MSRKKYSNIPLMQSGVVGLAAGAAAIANVFLDASSRIILTRERAGGATTDGLASNVTALGNGNGTFAIDSSLAGDVTTVHWVIFTLSGSPGQ